MNKEPNEISNQMTKQKHSKKFRLSSYDKKIR